MTSISTASARESEAVPDGFNQEETIKEIWGSFISHKN